jgi:hypothetical protein
MLISEILDRLPAEFEWIVLFDLGPIRALCGDEIVRQMYALPHETDLNDFSHVILTDRGALLACGNKPALFSVDLQAELPEGLSSMADRYSDLLALVPLDEAGCLGLGREGSQAAVMLFVTLEDEYGRGKAFFREEPSKEHYELLKAIGVEYQGGAFEGDYFVAQFVSHLPTHIEGGLQSAFERTGYCNRFSLKHGQIDSELEKRLLEAAADRIQKGRKAGLEALANMIQGSDFEELSLTCDPPAPQRSFAFGNVVPWGLVRLALYAASPGEDPARIYRLRSRLKALLDARRQRDLWPYHQGGLETSTDSALVLIGYPDPVGIEALERFADGQGRYFPQLWAEREEAGKTALCPEVRHWCQPDYPTTCLVRALRRRRGFDLDLGLDYIEDGFESRSGLFFANPYLVDWAVALALEREEEAEVLKKRLIGEILDSMNEDYSFACFDVALSTSLAVWALGILGYTGRALLMIQLRLLDFMGENGLWPEATPFYSTISADPEKVSVSLSAHLSLRGRPDRAVKIKDEIHHISFYRDTHRLISTAAAVLALSIDTNPEITGGADMRDEMERGQNGHPRYLSANPIEYIEQYALPPYLRDRT